MFFELLFLEHVCYSAFLQNFCFFLNNFYWFPLSIFIYTLEYISLASIVFLVCYFVYFSILIIFTLFLEPFPFIRYTSRYELDHIFYGFLISFTFYKIFYFIRFILIYYSFPFYIICYLLF